MTIAYCYASGHIGFGNHVPDGALEIARGPSKKLHDVIEVMARHAYDNKTLLVPGIPEAPNQREGINALCRFVDEVEKRLYR